MPARKTWISILIAVVIIVVVLCLAVVGGGVYIYTTHVSRQSASNESAADEFARARAKFPGQQALVDLRTGEPTVRRTQDAGRSAGELHTLHALAFDREDGKLVRADIPFWLLRFKSKLSFLPDMGSVTVDDLERHGPGLIVDFAETGRRGGQVLVWTD